MRVATLRAFASRAPVALRGAAQRQQPQPQQQRTFLNVWNMAKGFGFGAKPSLAGKRPLVKPGKVAPRLAVPPNIKKPPYADSGFLPPVISEYQIHNEEGIKRMRASGQLAARVLEYAGSLVKPGITTDEIDRAVHKMVTENNAYPSPLNYGKFPKSVCTSVNEVICHGIPDDRPLADGDIVNIDVTVFLDGYHGDTSRMFYVGQVDPEARKLCEVTKLSLDEAIKICKPGVPFKEIGNVISTVAEKHKYGVVRDFIGHGVGRVFHAAPSILHHRNNSPGVMQPWQTFTIEPMLAQGSTKVKMWSDDWTAVTADGGLSAQWEHTVLITPEGAEVLTKWEK